MRKKKDDLLYVRTLKRVKRLLNASCLKEDPAELKDQLFFARKTPFISKEFFQLRSLKLINKTYFPRIQ